MRFLNLFVCLSLCLPLAACSDDTVTIPKKDTKAPVVVDMKAEGLKAEGLKAEGLKTEGLKTDAPAAACPSCASDERCVQFLDGTCKSISLSCKKVSAACVNGACAACDVEICGPAKDTGIRATCQAAPCAGEVAAAFHCYGY